MFLLLCIQREVLASGEVIISEVAWMGTVPGSSESTQAASNNEWIELRNTQTKNQPVDGWVLSAADGSPTITLSGTISAGGYFLLERRSDDTLPAHEADMIYAFRNNALANTGEHLILKNQNGEVMDEVNGTSGWPGGNNETKETMQRLGKNWITALPTPGGETNGDSGISSGNTSLSMKNSSQPALHIFPLIHAYAGEDRKSVAGSEVFFSGSVATSEGEPLERVRFIWNFGDGTLKEGRTVSHIYGIPGTYTVGLHVSTDILVSSDYLLLTVVPNQLEIQNVILGEDGYIVLVNKGDVEVDIGAWAMKAGNATFIVPTSTKIGPRHETAFANKTTGLFREQNPPEEVSLSYPHGSLAYARSIKKTEKSSASSTQPLAASLRGTPVAQKKSVTEFAALASLPEGGKKEDAPLSSAQTTGSPYLFGLAILLSGAAAIGFLAVRR